MVKEVCENILFQLIVAYLSCNDICISTKYGLHMFKK